jgi:rhizosphere induced protein
MSGNGTRVVPAEPNLAAVFTPHPEYWISFGSFVPGQVIDTQTMVNSDQVDFPVNVYQMTATLDSGNNWTLAQGLV